MPASVASPAGSIDQMTRGAGSAVTSSSSDDAVPIAGAGEQRGGPYRSGGDFWSDIVFGDTIVVEYRPASAEKVVPFRIPEIAHLLSQ
jgi:hypothetical protein